MWSQCFKHNPTSVTEMTQKASMENNVAGLVIAISDCSMRGYYVSSAVIDVRLDS